jgi:Zn-finger nucleic acid-binding protein
MIILEYESVEVDFCVACAGIWLDSGELELLFGDRAITAGFLNAGDPAQVGTEKSRRCPICRKKMGKATSGGEHPVVYDHCSHGHGLWFDQGELAQVLEHGSTATGGDQVVHWLQEIFPAEPPD